MYVDPSRKLTEEQKVRLEWYAAMDQEKQRSLEQMREENRQETERRAKLATQASV
jgi:hypothetical protein